jgi:hypothetical protein
MCTLIVHARSGLRAGGRVAIATPQLALKETPVKRWKPIAFCAAVLCVGGYALAQDHGFDVPINSATPVPLATGSPAYAGFYWGGGEIAAIHAEHRHAPKSRADGMTAEQIAAALEAVQVQKAALDEWERELRGAAFSKRVAKWGVVVEPPAPPAPSIPGLGHHFGAFGGQ